MATLSFDGAVNIANRIVTEKFPGSVLYEADGTPSSGSAKDARGIDCLRVVFRSHSGDTIIMNSTKWGEFEAPQVIKEPWLEDQVIQWPVSLDLPEAVSLLQNAGFDMPFANVTLRKPLYPGVTQPSFIFGFADQGYVFVGCEDHKVTPHGMQIQI